MTYELFAGAWPDRSGEFADKMNAMPKHVVSTTLRDPQWNHCEVISGDVVAAVTRLGQQQGGPILVAGSRTLVHTLMQHDLVDEYRLMVFPVVLGSGRRLFPQTTQTSRHAEARRSLAGTDEHEAHLRAAYRGLHQC